MEPMDHHTLRDFLTNHPLLDGQSTGTHDYIHFRHLFWEHLVNRARAVAEDLTPLRTFEYEGRAPILLKSGRFGPYLTDGERNATLRKGEEEGTLTAERALEILEERGKEPQKKPGQKKAAARTGLDPAVLLPR